MHLVFCLRFWCVLGGILVALGLPKWSQVGAKIDPKNDQKKGCSSRAAKMGQRAVLGPSWGGLGAVLGGPGAAWGWSGGGLGAVWGGF